VVDCIGFFVLEVIRRCTVRLGLNAAKKLKEEVWVGIGRFLVYLVGR